MTSTLVPTGMGMTLDSQLVSSSVPILPVDMPEDAMLAWEDNVKSLSGSQRRITFSGNSFHFNDGTNDRVHSSRTLDMIILRASPKQHKLFYLDGWSDDDSKKGPPDVIWFADEEPPAEIPQSALEPDPKTGFLGYKYAQRLVVVPAIPLPDGRPYLNFEEPYIMDIGAKSIGFSNSKSNFSNPMEPMLTYVDLLDFCKKRSTQQVKVFPCHFKVTLTFDPQAKVMGVLRFIPQLDAQGNPAYFDAQQMAIIAQAIKLPQTKEMAEIKPVNRLRGSAPGATAPAQAPPMQQPDVSETLMEQVTPQAPTQPVAKAAPVAETPPPAATPPAAATSPDMAEALALAQKILNGAGADLNAVTPETEAAPPAATQSKAADLNAQLAELLKKRDGK